LARPPHHRLRRCGDLVAQIVDDGLHGGGVGLEILAAGIEFAFDLRHCFSFMRVVSDASSDLFCKTSAGPPSAGSRTKLLISCRRWPGH
jgi:hypothetical protein